MKRRAFFGTICLVSLSGCISRPSGLATTTADEPAESVAQERVIACERQYIKEEVITRDDETIEDSLEPEVVDTESRSGGEYVALETRFGTTRSSEDAPDEHLDQLVTAYYLVTDDGVYRTEDEEESPRDGIEVDC